MNVTIDSPALALLVRDPAYRLRSARVDLDMALSAAAMDLDVRVYFLGAAVLQLAADRATSAAKLPAGLKGWAALPDIGEISVYAEQDWLDRLADRSVPLILPVKGRDRDWMKTHWRQSRWAMVV